MRENVENQNAGKCGKNADQNISEYGHFLRSVNDSTSFRECTLWMEETISIHLPLPISDEIDLTA